MKFGLHMDTIMKEMCLRINVNFNTVDFEDKEWYLKYEWTPEQEDDFAKWMVDYLFKSSEARKEILSKNIKSKAYIKRAVNWFLFSYGWKIKNEKQGNVRKTKRD